MNDYQKKLLHLMEKFHDLCLLYDLRYYVIGGTFLGTIRHGGFIPWDDDIDVGMPRKDYRKLQNLLKASSGDYVLETPSSTNKDYVYNMSKLFDSTTTVIEKTKHKARRGIFIDIFPLDGIGNTEEEVNRNFKSIYWLNMFIATRTSIPRSERVWYKNVAICLSSIIPEFLVNTKSLICKLDNMCAKYDFDDNDYVGVLLGAYGRRDIMKKSLLGNPTEYKFEEIVVFGPEKAEEFLTNVYGDWKKLPPVDKRKSGHDFSYIDLNHSYLEN